MKKRPLTTYLNDHLAGAAGAIDVLSGLVRRHRRSPQGAVLRALLADIRADDRTLRTLAQALGTGPRWPKRLVGTLAGKVSRVRMRRLSGPRGAFALFEALELLSLGILGKRSLWRALRTVADGHAPIRRLSLDELETRAIEQFARVEVLRLQTARQALVDFRA
jgi:hypothetical protein